MWNFHITVLDALNSGKQNYMFIFFEVVNFHAWGSNLVIAVSFCLGFDIRLTRTISDLIPLANKISKFLNFACPQRVFIDPCRIGELWLFLVFSRLEESKILDSALHLCLVLILLSLLFVIWNFLPCARTHSESLSNSCFKILRFRQ